MHGEIVKMVLKPRPVFENDLLQSFSAEAVKWWILRQENLLKEKEPDMLLVKDPFTNSFLYSPFQKSTKSTFGTLVVPARRFWPNIDNFSKSNWYPLLERLEGIRLYEAALLVRSWEHG